jgi:hypothetical protein
MGGKGRQDLGKVDTPTNKKETRRETRGDKKKARPRQTLEKS